MGHKLWMILVMCSLATGCSAWQSFTQREPEWANARELYTCGCYESRSGRKRLLWSTGGVTFAECKAYCMDEGP